MANPPSDIVFPPITELLKSRRIAALFTALLRALAIGMLAGMCSLVLESIFRFPPTGRIVLLIIIAIAASVAGAISLVKLWASAGTPSTIAEEIERRHPEFEERLVAGLEFSSGLTAGSKDLAAAVTNEARLMLDDVDLRPMVNRRPMMRSATLVVAALVSIAVFRLSAGSSFNEALVRILAPTTSFEYDSPLTINVTPGDTRLARGDTLHVVIGFVGERPASVGIEKREAGSSEWTHTLISVPDTGVVQWQSEQLRSDIEYRAVTLDVVSPLYRVDVVERPKIRSLGVALRFPSYTRLNAVELPPNEGTFSAVPGTHVSVSLRPNKDLVTASLVFTNGDTIVALASGDEYESGFIVKRPGDYYAHLVDEYGFTNRNPILHTVGVIPDEPPSVRIVTPAVESDLDADMRVIVRMDAMDDFGFDRLDLLYKADGGDEDRLSIPLRSAGRGHAQATYVWDLGDMDILPEDRITYHVEVWDNDRISGPKRGVSDEHILRFPSALEVFADAGAEQEQQVEDIDRLREQNRDVSERMDALRRELLKSETLSWESKQEAQQLLEQHENMASEIERVASELQESIDKLERHNVLSPETLNKVSMVRELMSEIVSPELREALKRTQELSENLVDPDALREAMEELSEQQEELDQQLDRILDLLRQAQADQQLDAMQRRLEELAQTQQAVVENFDEQNASQLAARERTLSDHVADATEMIEDMADKMSDLSSSPSDSLMDIAQSLQEERVAERLSDLGDQIQTGERTSEQHGEASQLAQSLQRAANQMQQTAEQRRNKRTQDVTDKIDRAARDLLRVSMMQEGLIESTSRLEGVQALNSAGEEQVDLRVGTASVVDRVIEAAHETFLIPADAMRGLSTTMVEMNSAVSNMEQGNGQNARMHQSEAMAGLNRTVQALRKASESAQQSNSSTGFEQMMQQLSDMAQQQQSLNESMQQMPGQGNPSPSQMEMLAQLAAQQQGLAEAMRRMSGQMGNSRSVLGRLDDLADEMAMAAAELARGESGVRLRDRQQRILKRLLDAQRSLNSGRRGTDRNAETALDDITPRNPGALPEDLGERRIYLRRAMLEALQADYPPEYKTWIRHYYEQLMKDTNPE
jgi:hypothetical protein